MLLCFTATMFLSAALLFCVEPMVGKMLLPLLGGAPAVWITCMLFFQAALLAGYAYAHAGVVWLGVRRQAVLQAALLLATIFVLPIHIGHGAAASLGRSASPAAELLVLLALRIGLPFFVLSTTAPLVQRWFSRLGVRGSEDPYFLYGASNLGSMLALLAYPAVVEPRLGLAAQANAWRWGYAAFVVLLLSCAAFVVRAVEPPHAADPPATADATDAITPGRRVRWVALAFVPSSLLLGVTSYTTTDIAPIPLFWVVPLAVYIGTFILVFARRPLLRHGLMVQLLPFGASASAFVMLMKASTPIGPIVLIHLLALFLAAMVCHGELLRDRPWPRALTEFYLWIALGGVLGGVFNALIAPTLFARAVEYPLVIVLACLYRRGVETGEGPPLHGGRSRWLDYAIPAALGAAVFLTVLWAQQSKVDAAGAAFPLILGVPLVLNCRFHGRPVRFALGLGALLVAGSTYDGALGTTVRVERNFFGIVRVTHDKRGKFVQLAHGNTIHGRQSLDPARRREPLGYYHREGPLGDIFAAVRSAPSATDAGRRVAVIGLGAGTMAAYAEPTERWAYYEINPAVVSIAEDTRYFTYLRDAFPDAGRLSIVTGDARLRLGEAPDGGYDLLVLDAFSSDAIPMHLMTREAMALYLAKTDAHGVIAAHISNRYLRLGPVFADLAADARLAAFGREDTGLSAADLEAGRSPSVWVVMARGEADVLSIRRDARWVKLGPRGGRVWTDDFSDLLSAYRW